MLRLCDAHVGSDFLLLGDAHVRLRLLGFDTSGRPVMSVRSKTVINPCDTFPSGRSICVTSKARVPALLVLQVHAFEFGYYASLGDFEQRSTNSTRPKAVCAGILTCETTAHI